MWKRVFAAALLLWGGYAWWSARAVTQPPGVLAAQLPEQTETGRRPFEFDGYHITPLAAYTIEARVLSRENYHLGREADLSPTDFALGWARMSDGDVLRHLDISQSGRFYFWRAQELPIPQREIESSSANVHLIPADRRVAHRIADVRTGQVVQLRGLLVRVDAADGWHWASSLSRTDTGAGACELLWVEDLTVR